MARIHDLIIEAAEAFREETGITPHNVYLGDVEIAALNRWAYENNCTVMIRAEARGAGRPQVCGLTVYAVNEGTHLAVR